LYRDGIAVVIVTHDPTEAERIRQMSRCSSGTWNGSPSGAGRPHHFKIN
jgi:hypothetical protein